ncbi:short-chain fatty acid transporter [Quadrisphaera sp. GCM10027208]|uniref:short-chain fatty acid transporter n=1 Tax=Quadrisphaera sp. GCM10027208 TaxID=3273423 RepID=UPI003613BCFA
MLRTLSRPLVAGVERWLPSALVFAVVLTGVVAVLALALTDAAPVEVLRGWGDGLTGLLAFMTQMALILLLGYTLANTRQVGRLLVRAGSLPRTPVQAYAGVTLAAALGSLISWGLGLVVGALLAKEVARQGRTRGMRLHFPLLVACGYAGYVVWHMGYSGSGPLAAATPGSFVEEQIGRTIPVTETIFAPWNLLAIVVTVVVVVAAMASLRPRAEDAVVELPAAPDDRAATEQVGSRAGSPAASTRSAAGATGQDPAPLTPADRVDRSRVITTAAGLALAAYLVVYFAQEGFALTLDIVNWTFLAAILLLVRSPVELGALVADAARNVGDILLQFPLYAGILGIMTTSGLITVFSDFFVDLASPTTLGLWAFLSGGLVNMFIPSGGGQFAVQAPVFLQAAEQLGVAPEVVVMGIAYGDQWTNMIQPFWALPVLAIAGLGIRDILGYTTIALLVTGVVFTGTMLLVGAG